MARKRAPGGGRKPKGSAPGEPLTIRMPPDLRAELERAAKKRGRYLSEEILGRLRLSLAKQREEQRDPVVRALCYLISETANSVRKGDNPLSKGWQRNPFLFRAFKIGVTAVLDALDPPGEARNPFPPPQSAALSDDYSATPETLGRAAANNVLFALQRSSEMKEKWRFLAARIAETAQSAELGALIEELDYAMSDARRDLGIDKSRGPKT